MPEVLGQCPDCKADVIDPETSRHSKAVKCDLCSNWYHAKAKCQNVEDPIYKAINSKEGQMSLYWICKHCFQPGRGIMNKMAEIVTKLNEYEDRFKTLENKEKDSEATVKTYAATAAANAAQKYLQENPAEAVQKEEIIRTLKEEVKQDIGAGNWPQLPGGDGIQLQNRFEVLQDEINEREKEKSRQYLDEEKRKNNLVIYGVKESTENDKEKRTKHDKEEITRLSIFLGIENFTDYNIVRILRMGTYVEGTKRPILVELDCAVTKYKIMRNTFKLKDSDFKSWSIQHDMTNEQRETARKLVTEAKLKEKNDLSGEFIYRVRGPPHHKYIKKIKKTVQVVQDT